MKKLIFVFLICLFIFKAKADEAIYSYYHQDNFFYEDYHYYLEEPVSLKSNTDYIFFYYAGPTDKDVYSDALYDVGLGQEYYLELYTDNKYFKLEFIKYNHIAGTINYVNINLKDDSIIYEMIFPGLDYMNENFYFLEGTLFDYEYAELERLEVVSEIQKIDLVINGVIYSDYDNKLTYNEIVNNITVEDDFDGNITSDLLCFYDEYSGSKSLGEYRMIFGVADSFGNASVAVILVKVVDITDPIITGPSSLRIEIDNLISIEDILKQYQVTDNINDDLVIDVSYDEYSDATSKGEYSITLSVSDESGNIAFFDIAVEIYDDLRPTISFGDMIINKSESDDLTLVQIKAILKDYLVKNNVKYQKITIISNEYENNEKNIGEYEIVFSYYNLDEEVIDSIIICVNEDVSFDKGMFITVKKANNKQFIISIVLMIMGFVGFLAYNFRKFFKVIIDKVKI